MVVLVLYSGVEWVTSSKQICLWNVWRHV